MATRHHLHTSQLRLPDDAARGCIVLSTQVDRRGDVADVIELRGDEGVLVELPAAA